MLDELRIINKRSVVNRLISHHEILDIDDVISDVDSTEVDSFYWRLPPQFEGDKVRFYIVLHDSSSKNRKENYLDTKQTSV